MKIAHRILAGVASLLLFTVAFIFAGIYDATNTILAPWGMQLPALALFANTIDAGLKREKILNIFIEAFKTALLPFSAFSTDMTAEPLTEGDEVSVPYVPVSAAARVFAGTYVIQDTDWQKKKVTVDQHQYVSMGLSDKDVMKTPFATLEQQARMKAYQLAKAVLLDVFGIVTVANYGAAVFTGIASGFDLDDVADIRTACVKAGWPAGARSLIMAADYYGAVIKVDTFQNVNQAGSAAVRETGKLPVLYGFTPFECENIPANGENLVGAAAYPSAMGVAMRYLQPQPGNTYFDARALTDPETGITVGFRDWYDNDTGTRKQVFEALWGKSVIEPAALKRMVSA
jgi:hypothetical protein